MCRAQYTRCFASSCTGNAQAVMKSRRPRRVCTAGTPDPVEMRTFRLKHLSVGAWSAKFGEINFVSRSYIVGRRTGPVACPEGRNVFRTAKCDVAAGVGLSWCGGFVCTRFVSSKRSTVQTRCSATLKRRGTGNKTALKVSNDISCPCSRDCPC
jgi:hypothetical protein